MKKFKNTVPWTCINSNLNREEIVGAFCKKELQNTNQKVFRAGKVINRKSGELNIKWKGYDNSYNSWIDEKDIV